MPRLLSLLAFLLASCSTADGKWPDLAQRVSEVRSPQAEKPDSPPGDTATASQERKTAGPVSAAAMARLSEIEREIKLLQDRWANQLTALESALAAAQGAMPASEAWSKAQLELTRLEKVAARADDLRDSLNEVAGDLAVESQTSDVSAALRRTGALIERVQSFRAQHLETFARANRTLAR